MNPDEAIVKLLEGWLDGGLDEAAQSELLALLAADPELRRRLAAQVAALGATRAAADANPRWLALYDLLDSHGGTDPVAASFEFATMSRIESAGRRRTTRMAPVILGLAAAIMLSLAAFILIQGAKRNPADQTNTGAPQGAGHKETPTASAQAVAVAVAGSAESTVRPGDYLMPGVITQEQGWLTLQTLKGVAVTLEAPFEARLADHDRIHLAKGTARVRVPEGAEGFQLESPAFSILDLGTEFAAKVHADGTGTCRVFEGKAEVSLLDSMGESKQTRRLVASESVLINRSREILQAIDERDNDYPPIKQSPRQTLHVDSGYADTVLAMQPAGYWRFETLSAGRVPNEVPGPLQMHALGSAAIAPESGGNHSGDLTRISQSEFFKIQGGTMPMLERDFTISFFSQFSWLQNFALVSAMRYDRQLKGHSLILQCYASLSKIGINGSALHAVLRDPPAWDGGSEIVGAARLQPLRWHHIAMTREKDEVAIFLDGRIVARGAAGAAPIDCREIFIGRLNGNPSQSRTEARGMVGHIDELAVFPRALDQDGIRRLGLPGTTEE